MLLTSSNIQQVDAFTIPPTNDRFQQIHADGTHALISVSPFNSRLSTDYPRAS